MAIKALYAINATAECRGGKRQMARVTLEQSQQSIAKKKGLRMFNFEPGGLYHVLFLGEEFEGNVEPIIYENPTHNVKKDGKGFETRCANQEHNVENVIKLNADGTLLIDPKNGKPVNDGTCPYCEIRELHSQYVFSKRAEWIKENPTATKDQIKEVTRNMFKNAPVAEHTKRRIMLVAVYELDAKGKPLVDADGNQIYSIQGMRFTETQFTVKLMDQVTLKKMNLEDENDGGIAWHEYYFKYPKSDSKMLSGKDMSITPASVEVIAKNPRIKELIQEELAEINLDELEDVMHVFQLKSIEEMERNIAPARSRINENMTDSEIDDAIEDLGDDDIVDDEEISEIMGDSSFDMGISDEDIENLM